MSHKYFADQFEDEEVLLVFKKHPIVMRKELIFGGLAIPLSMLPSFFFQTFFVFYVGLAIGITLAFIIIFYGWIGWNFSVFIVTNQRFIQMTQKGLWKRSVVDIGIDKIQTVSYEIKGFGETLLKFGTIVVQTYVGELVIHEVYNPRKIQKQMSHILREQGPVQNHPMFENQEDD